MTKPATSPFRSLTALVLLSGLALAACERGTPATKPLRAASIKLQALTPDGTPGPAVDERAKVYNEVLTSLKSVADKGRNGETGAAYLLMAQAQAGLAETPASQAALQERLALGDIQGVRDQLSKWLTANALADAAASYDPTKELADIDAQVKEKQDQRVAAQQKKAGVDKAVADIMQQAAAKTEQAKAKRQASGAKKAHMASQTATQAEASLKEAQEIGRQADALEVEAATLEAQAAQRSPESAEVQLEIDKLSSQKELLEKSRAAVNARAESAKAQAAASRKEAADAAAQLAKNVKTMDDRREGDLATATDAAASGFKTALASAQKANTDAKGSSQMAAGSMQQALGDVHWGRARGLSAYASLMDTLAAAKPALPDAGQYKTKADKARADAKEALGAATEAYTAADTAYRAGSGPQMRERILSVNAALADIVQKTSDGKDNIRDPEAAPKNETPATPEAPAAGGDTAANGESPQATMAKLKDTAKSGQYDKLFDLFLFNSDEEKTAMRSALTLMTKLSDLDRAVKAKFGSGMDMGSAGFGANPFAMLENIDVNALEFKIDGDKASTHIPGDKDTTDLIRKDGKWYIDPGLAKNAATMGQIATMAGPMSKAVDEIIADINSGKIKSQAEVGMALGMKLMPMRPNTPPKGK